ncbi:UNVERIFIED_CONTAM: SAM-dependent methyltransferase [Brevibacillus sp. OAP136]
MYQGVRMGMNGKEQWLEGMKNWQGYLPQRMTDDVVEEAFWREHIRKHLIREQVAPHVKKIQTELFGFIEPGDHVLEIGPGMGTYSFDVAQKAARYTAVDSSQGMIDFLREEMERRGVAAATFVHAKWEEHKVSEQADIVFGVNCYYRMQQIDRALVGMNNAARRLAVIALTSGPERPHLLAIHRELGCNIRFQRRDYIHLTNMLYELGIDANCRILDLERTYHYENEEQLVKENLKAIMDENYDRQAAKEILHRYVEPVADGGYRYTHRFKAALLYWRPEQLL